MAKMVLQVSTSQAQLVHQVFQVSTPILPQLLLQKILDSLNQKPKPVNQVSQDDQEKAVALAEVAKTVFQVLMVNRALQVLKVQLVQPVHEVPTVTMVLQVSQVSTAVQVHKVSQVQLALTVPEVHQVQTV